MSTIPKSNKKDSKSKAKEPQRGKPKFKTKALKADPETFAKCIKEAPTFWQKNFEKVKSAKDRKALQKAVAQNYLTNKKIQSLKAEVRKLVIGKKSSIKTIHLIGEKHELEKREAPSWTKKNPASHEKKKNAKIQAKTVEKEKRSLDESQEQVTSESDAPARKTPVARYQKEIQSDVNNEESEPEPPVSPAASKKEISRDQNQEVSEVVETDQMVPQLDTLEERDKPSLTEDENSSSCGRLRTQRTTLKRKSIQEPNALETEGLEAEVEENDHQEERSQSNQSKPTPPMQLLPHKSNHSAKGRKTQFHSHVDRVYEKLTNNKFFDFSKEERPTRQMMGDFFISLKKAPAKLSAASIQVYFKTLFCVIIQTKKSMTDYKEKMFLTNASEIKEKLCEPFPKSYFKTWEKIKQELILDQKYQPSTWEDFINTLRSFCKRYQKEKEKAIDDELCHQ